MLLNNIPKEIYIAHIFPYIDTPSIITNIFKINEYLFHISTSYISYVLKNNHKICIESIQNAVDNIYLDQYILKLLYKSGYNNTISSGSRPIGILKIGKYTVYNTQINGNNIFYKSIRYVYDLTNVYDRKYFKYANMIKKYTKFNGKRISKFYRSIKYDNKKYYEYDGAIVYHNGGKCVYDKSGNILVSINTYGKYYKKKIYDKLMNFNRITPYNLPFVMYIKNLDSSIESWTYEFFHGSYSYEINVDYMSELMLLEIRTSNSGKCYKNNYPDDITIPNIKRSNIDHTIYNHILQVVQNH